MRLAPFYYSRLEPSGLLVVLIFNVFPLSHSELGRCFDKHCVDNTALEELEYANPHVWELANVKRFNIPIPHDGGRHMVTWGRPYAGVIPD